MSDKKDKKHVGDIRASQILTTYGPGSLIDFPYDPGCGAAGDDDEQDPLLAAQCADGRLAVRVGRDRLESDNRRWQLTRRSDRRDDRHGRLAPPPVGVAGDLLRSTRGRVSLGTLRCASRTHPLGVRRPLPWSSGLPLLLPHLRLLSLGNGATPLASMTLG